MSTATLVPKLTDGVTVYLVLNDFGPLGRADVETDEAKASERDVISDISSGQHSKPIRVVSCNTSEGWSRDVTEDIAQQRDATEIRRQPHKHLCERQPVLNASPHTVPLRALPNRPCCSPRKEKPRQPPGRVRPTRG